MDAEALKALIWSFEWAQIAVHSQAEGPNATQLASLSKIEALIQQEQLAAKG